jgi:hypothetical protein
MVWLAAADQGVTVESDLGGYISEIRRFPMLGAQEGSPDDLFKTAR